MSESLPKLLLRLSEAGEPAILWGRQARPYVGRDFDRLVGRRLLVEEAPATEWQVCSACECGLDARPIEEIDGRLVALCPLDHRADTHLAPDDLRSFRIDGGVLAGEIARASGFGTAPVLLAEGVWELERLPGDRAAVLVLAAVAASDPNLVAIMRATTRAAAVTLLLPARHDPAVRRRIDDAGIHTVRTMDALAVGDRAAPFALDAARLVPGTAIAPRLVVLVVGQKIVLNGREAALSERSFKLLQLLAEAAIDNGGVVSHKAINQRLWATTVSARAVADAVRDLREQIRPVLPPGEDPAALIETRHGRGYALALAPQAVLIRR